MDTVWLHSLHVQGQRVSHVSIPVAMAVHNKRGIR